MSLTQTSLVVGLDNITLDNLASSDTTVVLALTVQVLVKTSICPSKQDLRSRETTSGPAVRSIIRAEQGVLLLKTEPRHLIGVLVHNLHAVMTEVVLVGGAIGVPALSKNNDVG
jgi:hypothetical protein